MDTTAKGEFARRLNELCDDMQLPSGPFARAKRLAEVLSPYFSVSPNGTRKWLVGEGYPNQDKAEILAKLGSVTYEWLMTGRLPKQLPVGEPGDSREVALLKLWRETDERGKAAIFRVAETQSEFNVETQSKTGK